MMKTATLNLIFRSIAALVLTSAGSVVFAASNWTTTNFGTACSSTSGTEVAAAGLWGHCGTGTVADNIPEFAGWASAGNSATAFVGARVFDYDASGLGVVASGESSSSTGPHAIDNYGGADGIVFRFGEAVNLNNVSIGWNGTDNVKSSSSSIYKDSDMSVYAWIGAGTPTPSATSAGSNVWTGWSLIGNYTDVGASNNTSTTKNAGGSQSFSTSIYSSYWLVGATRAVEADTVVDAFKVLQISGSSCANTISGTQCVTTPPQGVPEPGSIALLGLGLVGIAAARRRKQASL